MTVAWLFTALALLGTGAAGLAGGLLPERWLVRHSSGLIGFAAGALLAAAFLDVLPESVQSLGSVALTWAFVGFVASTIVEWLLGHHHLHEKRPATLPLTLLTSDALHNLADGAAIAAAFLISPRVGVAVTLAVMAHELPQEIGDYALLRSSGYPRRRALLSLAAVQLTAVLGALSVLLAAARFEAVTAAVLSVAAGAFLYLGATDLLPEVHSGRTPGERRERLFGLLGGISLIALASFAGT